MQERIQRLIDRLDTLLEKGKIDQKTYEQMREAFEIKLKEVQDTSLARGANEKKEQLLVAEQPHRRIMSELEELGVEIGEDRPPRVLITYLQAKSAYRDLLGTKKTLIEQGAQIREKYQKKQISKKDFLRTTLQLSQSLSELSESIETKRTILLESRGRTFKLHEKLIFLKKKKDALEKALALGKIDNEAFLALNQELTSEMSEIRHTIQLDIDKLSRWIVFFERELQHRQIQLKQSQTHEQVENLERNQQKINELLKFIEILHADVSMFSSVIADIPPTKDERELDSEVREVVPIERPIEVVEEEEIVAQVEDIKTAWDCVGKTIRSNARDMIGICSRPLIWMNQLYLEIVKINEVQDSIIEEIYNQIRPSLTGGEITTHPIKRRTIIADYISKVVGVEKTKALSPTVVGEFFRRMKIPLPDDLDQVETKPVGLVPYSTIRELDKTFIIVQEESIEPPTPEVQLAFVEERFTPSECIGSTVRDSMGRVKGQISEVFSHPMFGQIMFITSESPRPELLDRILSQTNQVKSKALVPEEKTWLLQFLVAKRLEIVEPEALSPENLISYCFVENIPLLPNDIRISYLSWISAGFLQRSGTDFSIIGSDAILRSFPEGIYEVEYKRVITEDAKKLGYALGFDYTEEELKIVYASHFSEKLIPLISGSSVQRDDIESVFAEMKHKISEKLNISIEKGLMPSNVLRYLLKEKLGRAKKLTAVRQEFKTIQRLFKMEIIDFKNVEVKENEIILKETPKS